MLVYVQVNLFSGPMPDLSGLVHMHGVFLDRNLFNGTFTNGLHGLRLLTQVFLSNNR